MAVLDLTRQTLDAAEEAARRNRMIDASFKAGGIILLGSTVYMGWWLYRFFTDVNISFKNSLGSVIEQDWPPLNPYLATDSCADELYVLWGGEAKTSDPAMMALAQLGRATNESPDFKMIKWDALRRKIDPDTGAFMGYSGEYSWAKRVESEAVRAGIIDKSSIQPEHPVDRIAGLIVDNKWYWGTVLGIASVPPLMVIGDEARRMIRDER